MNTAVKIAYLTFDDGPSEGFRQKVDYLNSLNIQAIWFCLGERLAEFPEEAIYAIEKGHVIANHSYSHPHFSEIGLSEAREQIDRTERLIEQLYEQAGVVQPFKLFRFPYLDHGAEHLDAEHPAELQALLRERGYRQPLFEGIRYEWYLAEGFDQRADIACTYDSMDWCLADGQELYGYRDLPTVLARMDENVPEGRRGLNDSSSNEIVMMHEWIPYEAFTALIDKLFGKGIAVRLPGF